ncbi:MAG: amidase [Dehalococcoidia bacterium]
MSAEARSTRELFQSAVSLVREWPLDPPDRPPAFALDRPPSGELAAGPGEPGGLDGDLWDTGQKVASGERSVMEVAQAALAAADQFDAAFKAFEFRDNIREAATALGAEQRDHLRGPLHGVPVTVKDIIDVRGMPTTGSSVALAPRQATEDATAVARLRAAGAVVMGKVTTHEFALGVTTPQARSPWDPARVPGGSSGGSAISVVTGMALASLGTDTRASIRVPSALCGLVGFKPSHGLIPTDRWHTLSWSLDHFAPMARSVRDIALLMDILTAAPSCYTSVLPGSLTGQRIGFAEATLAGADPEVVARFHEALETMASAGASVRRLEGPTADDFALANAAGMVVSRAEAAHYHREAGTKLDLCTPEVRDQLSEATRLLATDYVRALRLRGQLRDRLTAQLSDVDVLALPTCKVVAPLVEEADRFLLVLSENCIPWSLVDFPAISVYMGLARGLPSGIQFVGPPGQDRSVLHIAHAFEQVSAPPPRWRPE